MAKARMLPGFGMVAETATKARMLPGIGVVAETSADAATKLLLLNPPGLDGGLNGGLTFGSYL